MESIARGDPGSPGRASVGETARRHVGGALMDAAGSVSTTGSGDMQPEGGAACGDGARTVRPSVEDGWVRKSRRTPRCLGFQVSDSSARVKAAQQRTRSGR